MHDIYIRAQRIVVWLGEADKASIVAFNALDKIVLLECRDRQSNRPLSSADLPNDVAGVEVAINRFEKYRHIYLNDFEKMKAMAALLTRPWFSRIWVVQETINACEILV